MICYTDTAEFFTQAIAVPNIDSDGESLSCFSYSCTAEGTSSSKCQTPLSHGWELTSACKARSNNPAFADVKCCNTNTCNPPTDIKLWNYVGPADNTAHLSCYFNAMPGFEPNEAHSVVYGPWSGAQETPTGAACLRYQQKNTKTGAPLDSWTYAAIDLAACDLETGKPVGNTYNSVAVVSTVMCCAEPDCNAPDPQLDSLTKAGPTITQALLQQGPSFDVSSMKRVNKAATTGDGEVAPLPHTLQAPTNSDGVVVYKPMAGATAVNEQADIDEQANSMLEYQLQLLQSGVMPMAEDVYSSRSYGAYGDDGAYGGYGAGGAYGSQVSTTSATEKGTLLLYPTTSPAGSSASTKSSGSGAVRTSLSVVALTAAIGAALAIN